MNRISRIACSVILAGAWGGKATAAPLTLDGGWQEFSWRCGDSSDLGTCTPEEIATATELPPDGFSFTLLEPGLLRVTDLYVSGDMFSFLINGVPPPLVSTPVPNPGFLDLGHFQNYDFFYNSDEFSHFTRQLDPGVYTITIGLAAIALCLDSTPPPDGPGCNPAGGDFWKSGVGAIRVDSVPETAVPEPASMLLLGTGLGGLWASRRGRRNCAKMRRLTRI